MSDVFFDAVTCIREDLIEEAQNYVFRRRQVWKRWAGLAAGILLAACLGWRCFIFPHSDGLSGMNGGAAPGSMESAPAGDCDGGAAAEHVFTADVVEAGEGYFLVVPLPGNGFWTVADRVTVPTDGAAVSPGIRPGDQVEIIFAGEALSGSVTGVIEITALPQLSQ